MGCSGKFTAQEPRWCSTCRRYAKPAHIVGGSPHPLPPAIPPAGMMPLSSPAPDIGAARGLRISDRVPGGGAACSFRLGGFHRFLRSASARSLHASLGDHRSTPLLSCPREQHLRLGHSRLLRPRLHQRASCSCAAKGFANTGSSGSTSGLPSANACPAESAARPIFSHRTRLRGKLSTPPPASS